MRHSENTSNSNKNETFKLKIQALDVNKARTFKAHLISDFLSFTTALQNDLLDNTFKKVIENEFSFSTNDTLSIPEPNIQLVNHIQSNYQNLGIKTLNNHSAKIASVNSIRTLKSDNQNEFSGKILNLLI
jgi:hypothetical protein